ncbi:hypothetical protein GH714_019799 [Hevea brasiliensis]|uniref:Uncharacterized protein n=1 Tax=Hevea brasiliensis TaxID=3981 RepID=A0A6A6MBU6_HEVBR|nr:hypothetical protein GH714_019799 [Hevea brasiliensis]
MAKIPSSAAGAATVSSLSEETSSVSTETIISNDLPPGSAEEIMELFDHSGEVLLVDGSIVRSGRNLSVVAMEFKIKKTRKLVYTAVLLSITCLLPSYEFTVAYHLALDFVNSLLDWSQYSIFISIFDRKLMDHYVGSNDKAIVY